MWNTPTRAQVAGGRGGEGVGSGEDVDEDVDSFFEAAEDIADVQGLHLRDTPRAAATTPRSSTGTREGGAVPSDAQGEEIRQTKMGAKDGAPDPSSPSRAELSPQETPSTATSYPSPGEDTVPMTIVTTLESSSAIVHRATGRVYNVGDVEDALGIRDEFSREMNRREWEAEGLKLDGAEFERLNSYMERKSEGGPSEPRDARGGVFSHLESTSTPGGASQGAAGRGEVVSSDGGSGGEGARAAAENSRRISLSQSTVGIHVDTGKGRLSYDQLQFGPRSGQPYGTKCPVYGNRKNYNEFSGMRHIQTINVGKETGSIWTMKFHHHGRLLATAGQDGIIRLWQVTVEDGAGAPGAEDANEDAKSTTSDFSAFGAGDFTYRAATDDIFSDVPYREWRGHKRDILDVCWSKSYFLLSASMDRTVRLWHASMDECLRVFVHTDFVASVAFNPKNDKIFVSGSLDNKARLWSVPEHRVVDYVDIHEMVTAVAVSPDGITAVVGSFKGRARFYRIDGARLEYQTTLDVKHARASRSTVGKKITGLCFLPGDSNKLLVTSNDSRVRLYQGQTLICKYKGLVNEQGNIQASCSRNGDFIVCASEDKSIFLWNTVNPHIPSINPFFTGFNKLKHDCFETFSPNVGFLASQGGEEQEQDKDIYMKSVTATALSPMPDLKALATAKLEVALAADAALRKGARIQDWTLHDYFYPVGGEGSDSLQAPGGGDGRSPGSGGAQSNVQLKHLSDSQGRNLPAKKMLFTRDPTAVSYNAVGQLIVCAGHSGLIRVFENFGLPRWTG